MWSQDNKAGLLRHLPQAILFDSLGSSEAVGLGGSMSVSGAAAGDGQVRARAQACAVFTDDGRRVEPGIGEPGMVAVSGYIPLGYYKDEAKSAQTFRTFEGAPLERARRLGRGAAPTARCTCSAAARCASTPAARRSSPRRSRRR